jgi:hypothetical protein
MPSGNKKTNTSLEGRRDWLNMEREGHCVACEGKKRAHICDRRKPGGADRGKQVNKRSMRSDSYLSQNPGTVARRERESRRSSHSGSSAGNKRSKSLARAPSVRRSAGSKRSKSPIRAPSVRGSAELRISADSGDDWLADEEAAAGSGGLRGVLTEGGRRQKTADRMAKAAGKRALQKKTGKSGVPNPSEMRYDDFDSVVGTQAAERPEIPIVAPAVVAEGLAVGSGGRGGGRRKSKRSRKKRKASSKRKAVTKRKTHTKRRR